MARPLVDRVFYDPQPLYSSSCSWWWCVYISCCSHFQWWQVQESNLCVRNGLRSGFALHIPIVVVQLMVNRYVDWWIVCSWVAIYRRNKRGNKQSLTTRETQADTDMKDAEGGHHSPCCNKLLEDADPSVVNRLAGHLCSHRSSINKRKPEYRTCVARWTISKPMTWICLCLVMRFNHVHVTRVLQYYCKSLPPHSFGIDLDSCDLLAITVLLDDIVYF